MRYSFYTLAAFTTAFLTACNGGSSNGSQTQDSTQVQMTENVASSSLSQGSTSQASDENIALTVWERIFKGKPSANAKINGSFSIQDEEMETIEYEDGGMVNSYTYKRIACFPMTDNSWKIVEYLGYLMSDSGETECTVYSYTYSNGTLTLNESEFIPEINSFFSEVVRLNWNEEDNSYFGTNAEFDFGTDYALIISNGNAVALNWNGASFSPTKPTEKQFLSEEALFKKVAAVFPYLKDKEVNISFDTDYCEWGDFFIDSNRYSYGRYKKNDGSYLIYVSCTPKEARPIIYKYSYNNGKLDLLSENAFFDEVTVGTNLNDGKEHEIFIKFESNPFKCSAFTVIDEDYDNSRDYVWNGESFK